jgi:hypothetical protein
VMAKQSTWNWDLIYQAWRTRFDAFALDHLDRSTSNPVPLIRLDIDALFHEIELCDPSRITREDEIGWWGRSDYWKRYLKCQSWLDNHPKTTGLVEGNFPYSSFKYTLSHLWENQANWEIIAAILIQATLFPYVDGRAKLQRSPVFESIYQTVLSRYRVGYPHTATHVMPGLLPTTHHKAICSVIDELAAHHVEVLTQNILIVAKFGDHRNPEIAAELERKNRDRAAKAEIARLLSQERLANSAKPPKPSLEAWLKLSKSELETLVWTKPAQQLATELGVSDVAIAKRCRREGICKPPLGFWAKVQAGKIPHPNGSVPDLG